MAINYFLSRELVFRSADLDGSNMRETCPDAGRFPTPIFTALFLNPYSPGCMAALQGCVLGQDGIGT